VAIYLIWLIYLLKTRQFKAPKGHFHAMNLAVYAKKSSVFRRPSRIVVVGTVDYVN